MSLHDTHRVQSPPASAATPACIITQSSDLVLQACGLGSTPSTAHFSQIQQGESTPRRRGRPQQVSWTQLWSSLLLCALQGMHSFADWRRLLGWQSIGPFTPVWLTRNGLVKRLLQAGLVPLQDLWERINAQLASLGSQAVPASLASFATEIFCLDETRLDAVGRYLKPLRGLSTHDPACFAGKLVGLLDLRAQRWLRLEWREDVNENCRVDMLEFLQGLSEGSLLLFDLGYFSFSFFDTLTQWKLWWVSRYRENTSYQIAHVFYRQREILDALVWLGTGQKQARHLVRLVRLSDGIGVRMYLTNVCDPQVLSLAEVAQLYARRWDIDVVELYLHRGAFEPALADEDREQDPDRWCSHSAWGQECWQLVSQWVWNLRLELGHQLHPDPVRTTEFAPATPPALPHTAPPAGYAPPQGGSAWKAGRFSGHDFALQPDGTLCCPANQSLVAHEQRREADGSLRVVYGASIRSCRPCPLREQCQWQGSATAKPRQVSVLLHPLGIGSEPILWRDWSRRFHRRACIQLVRHQCVKVELEPSSTALLTVTPAPLSRAQRAHSRLSWTERLARNARPHTAGRVTIKLFGVPQAFATQLGLTVG